MNTFGKGSIHISLAGEGNTLLTHGK